MTASPAAISSWIKWKAIQIKSCSRWAAELPGVLVATSVELPYANAGGREVTAQSAAAFGRDLAVALSHYLKRG